MGGEIDQHAGRGMMGFAALYPSYRAIILAALLISFAIHMAVILLSDLFYDGLIDPGYVFAGSAAALSLVRAIATLFAGLGIAGFTAPGGIVMGIILVALAVSSFSKIGR
jgi:ABC-type Fe3+-siderophore transport system permease subunit